MERVNNLVNVYREAVRNLWNCYFREKDGGIPSISICESFDVIAGRLFSCIVLNELGLPLKKGLLSENAGSYFDVEFRYNRVPVMINRSIPAGSYWDYPVSELESTDFVFRFIDLFDWNKYEFMDSQYFRIEIVSAAMNQRELIGRHALVECRNARIVLSESGPTRL